MTSTEQTTAERRFVEPTFATGNAAESRNRGLLHTVPNEGRLESLSKSECPPVAVRPEPDIARTAGLPQALLEAYVARAVSHAVVREVDPGVWAATIAGFDGAWADGDSPEDAIEALPGILADWIAFRRERGDRKLPVLDGLDPNVP